VKISNVARGCPCGCDNCGTTIYEAPSRFPDKIFFTAGTLDDPTGFTTDVRVYEDSQQRWDNA